MNNVEKKLQRDIKFNTSQIKKFNKRLQESKERLQTYYKMVK